MDTLENSLMSGVKKLLNEYIKYDDDHDVTKMLKVFDKLDFRKIAKKIDTNLNGKHELIDNKDETLFQSQFIILPGADISKIWGKIDSGNREKIWVSLKIISMASQMILSYLKMEKCAKERNIEFDPYKGVIGEGLSTDGLTESMGDMDIGSGGLDAALKLLGSDQLGKLNKLTEQLKEMTDEEIDQATDNIKHIFGETSEGMNEMLKAISLELKSGKSIKDGADIATTLNDIAESVAARMRPKIERGEVNGEELFKTTQGLMSKMMPHGGMMDILKKQTGIDMSDLSSNPKPNNSNNK